MLLKLLERLPTNRILVVIASSLSPVNMARIASKAQKKFQKMADNLFSLKFITSSVADIAKFHYDQFISREAVINQEKLLKFNFKTDRLDSFLYQFVAINADNSDLWKVMKLIFIATRGQSFSERGFSINKLTSDVNIREESLIVQRVIYDAMISADADAGSFPKRNKIDVRKPVRDRS